MIDGFTDAQVIGGLFALLVASYAAFFAWLVRRFDRVEAKIDALDLRLSTRIDAVDTKLNARIDAVDNKLSAKIDALTIAVSRLEGAVYHGLPAHAESER
jgi:hypothetical protein